MAGNKFATMLQKNTHKLAVILVYAVLEWILIILLLLNSFFTYLITKFANYFGLKPPCLWCSRVDHVLEPGNNINNDSYRHLICETHAAEISNLGYCSNHRRLAETQNMCMDCLASRPNHGDDESIGITRRIAFVSWVSCRDTLENGDKVVKCSCCNESLNSSLYPPYLLVKPSWKTLKYTQKGNFIIEAMDDDFNGNDDQCKLMSKVDSLGHYNADCNETERNDGEELQMLSDIGSFGLKDSVEEECSGSESNLQCEEKEGHEDQKADCNETERNDGEELQMLSDSGSFGLRDSVEEECSGSESNLQCEEKEGNEDQKADSPCITEQGCYVMDFVHQSFDEDNIQHSAGEDSSLEITNLQFHINLESEFNRLIPIELIDSSTFANHGSFISKEEDLGKLVDRQDESYDSSLQIETQVIVMENEENTSFAEVEKIEMNMDDGEDSSVLNLEEMRIDFAGQASEQALSLHTAQSLSTDIAVVAAIEETNYLEDHEQENNDFKLLADETKSKPFIELPSHANDQPQEHESTPPQQSPQADESFTSEKDAKAPDVSEACMVHNELGLNYKENALTEEKMNPADKNQEPASQHSFTRSESNEAEEEKFPETPTSVESFNYLNKKLGAEESLDGSVMSETDSGDPVLTAEKLKTALKAERKALNALYSELEEERSASAIAANQTMAMINRLQEEKAAMQMEALQYQRMMEEQSEYDQEALQLLNELMMKREREKQELEKELEVYRKKVLEYEAKEKMRMIRRSKDGSVRSRNSSATCSNAEDIDELSIDLNREARDEDGIIYGNQDSNNINTPGDEVIDLEEIALDCVKQISTLDDSLAEFEEERLSILDQLKALEERLISLHDNEMIQDRNSVGSSSKYSEKGFEESCGLSTPEENGMSHGLPKDKLYTERKTMGSMAKSLLPLLDAAENETEEGLTFEECAVSDFLKMEIPSVSNFELDSKKLALEEEVDHVYERLQALEADREFLKHCMSSIQKGDKGMDLLQEILQHLRDLRAVELRVRNMNEDTLDEAILEQLHQ